MARFGCRSLLFSSFPRYTCKVNKTGGGRAAAAEAGGRALSIIVTSSAAAGGGKEISEEAEGGLDVSLVSSRKAESSSARPDLKGCVRHECELLRLRARGPT